MSEAARKTGSNVTPLRPKQVGGAGKAINVPPARRAAVVIAMLGQTAAKPIVDKLDDAALAQVAAELEAVSYLGREELTEIVMDFLQTLRQTTGAFRGGKSKAREIVTGLLDESRVDHVFGQAAPKKQAKPEAEISDVWERLEKRKPEAVAEYLNRLTPNIISIILRRLDVSFASEIVGNLTEGKLDASIGYLVGSTQSDPEIEAVVGQMIEIEFLNQAVDDDVEETGDMEPVGELLSLLSSDRRDRLMSFLKIEHTDKFVSIEKLMFTIENLAEMLPRQSVPVVFRELGEDRMTPLLSTLTGPLDALQEYLLSNISSRLAVQYRDALGDEALKPVKDVEAEQRGFLTALMSLKRRGLIVIEKAQGPEEA
jgi:flagellar motor switch protein FliG